MKPRALTLPLGLLLAWLMALALCHLPQVGADGPLGRALISLELDSYDLRLRLLQRSQPDPRVALIAIDVDSLDEYGAMPWDRRIHAALIDKLTPHAKALAFDVAFAGQRHLRGQEASPQDEALVRSVAASGKVVVARYVDLIQRYDAATGAAQIQRRIQKLPQGLEQALEGKRGIGLVFCQTDPDHGLRTTWLRVAPEDFGMTADGSQRVDYLPLAVQALNKMTGEQRFELARLSSGWQAFFDGRSLPIWNEAPLMLLDYPGKPFVLYSYRDVVEGKVAPEVFAGKLVLIGSSYDLADSFHVPRNPAGQRGSVPGLFVHAALADQLLSGRGIRFAPYPLEGHHASPWLMGWSWGLLLAGLAAVLHLRLRLAPALGLSLLAGAVFVALASLWMVTQRCYLNVTIPLLMLFVSQLPVVLFELRQIRQVLRWFVPAEHVEGLMRSESVESRTHSQIATVLFVDIRDYTTLSEKLIPSEVRSLVSRFHTTTAQVIEGFGGYVCDFQGDAQMVAFGITPARPDHAHQAIAAAAALPRAVAQLNRELAHEYPQLCQDGGPVFRFGVGICTGEVSVGYLQGGGKLQHTVLGDTTNTAARLQGLARDLGVTTVVSHTSADRALDWKGRLRPLESAKLKGKAEPHAIFELVDAAD